MYSEQRSFDRLGSLLSLAIHACAALLVVTFRLAPGSDTVAESRGIRVDTIRIVRAALIPKAAAPVATPRPIAMMQRLADLPNARRHITGTLVPRPHPSARVYAILRSTEAREAKPADAEPAVLPLRATIVRGDDDMQATPPPPPTPLPTPTEPRATAAPSTSTKSAATALGAGPGVFGQNRRADLGGSITLAELTAIAGGAFHVRVLIDETGRAREITVIVAPRNLEELRQQLLAAHFVPAECDGLYCDDTIDLRG